MKLRYQLAYMELDGEISAVPVGPGADSFRGMLKLNGSGAELLNLLEEETTPDRVHARLKERYPDSDDREIGGMLADFLNRLLREGLLLAP